MKLKGKLLIISIAGIIFTFAASTAITWYYYGHEKQKRIRSAVATAQHNFNVALDAKKDVWQTNALQIASNQQIVSAIKNGNRDDAQRLLNGLGSVFKEHTTFRNVEVHLIDQDLRSFFKSWNKDRFGEELGHSKGYLLVKQQGKSQVAMEMSSKGLRLKGLFPIVEQGNFLGIANFEGGLNSLKLSLKPYGVDFLYFMDAEDAIIAPQFESEVKLGPYILNQKNGDEEFSAFLNQAGMIDRVLAKDYVITDDYLAFKGHFADFTGAPVGLYLLGMKTELVMADIYALRGLMIKLFSGLFGCFLFLLFLLVFFIGAKVINPLNSISNSMEDIAIGEGDLTKRIHVQSSDEIGILASRFNDFMEKIHTMIKEIIAGVNTLSTSSSELTSIAQQMSSNAVQTAEKAQMVATAAEDVSSNITSVSAAMEQSAMNSGMVASAAEEMTGTINEIARNAENARGVSERAVQQTQSASKEMAQLGEAAHAIGKVTETITDISEQTNLLALNATIEAARAGDAGKGFAVVANEIKELAKQTAEATLDIRKQIEGVQYSTEGTIDLINQVGEVISQVNDIVSTIATAVEEQSVTTKEIAENITQASTGIGEVNENVAQSSLVVNEISRDISEINGSSEDMTSSSAQVRTSSEELAKLAKQLDELVGRFKV